MTYGTALRGCCTNYRRPGQLFRQTIDQRLSADLVLWLGTGCRVQIEEMVPISSDSGELDFAEYPPST